MSDLDEGKSVTYSLKGEGTGVYIFLLEGELEVAGEKLNRRDAIGITDVKDITLSAQQDASVLIMEVPMF